MSENTFLLKFRKRSLQDDNYTQVYHGTKPSDLRPVRDDLHNQPEDESESTFYKISDQFCDSLMSYLNITNDLLRMDQMIRDVLPIEKVKAAIDGRSKLIKKRPRFEVYECDVEAWPDISLAFKDRRQRLTFSRQLPGTILTGVIAQFDHLVQQLVREVINLKPEIISQSERAMTFKELQAFSSIDDARDYISNKYIESLTRKSHFEQFKDMEVAFGLELRKGLQNFPNFLELCQRRHCVIHNGGVVSQSYLEKLKEQGIESTAKIGDRLPITAKYFLDSVSVVFEIGFKLIQVLWRKFNPEDNKMADHEIVNQPLYLLQIEHYDLSAEILSFASKYIKNWENETNELMVQVNHANALKLSGRTDECAKILDGTDWGSRSANFQICVAAVRDDLDNCLKLLEKHKDTSKIGLESIIAWPVFYSLRTNLDFQKGCEKIFGKPFLPSENEVQENKSKEPASIQSSEIFG